MPGISAVGTLARYFSLRFFIAMLAMFMICCILIFFVDFIEMLRRASEKNPNVRSLGALASFYEQTNDYASAADTLKRMLPLQPRWPRFP